MKVVDHTREVEQNGTDAVDGTRAVGDRWPWRPLTTAWAWSTVGRRCESDGAQRDRGGVWTGAGHGMRAVERRGATKL